MREYHHGYLDEHSKTVSARQAETFEVVSNQFAVCCRLKPADAARAEVVECALSARPNSLESLVGQNVKTPLLAIFVP